MPYIDCEARERVLLIHQGIRTQGELNFAITTLVDSYLKSNGPDYAAINDVVGALECAKLEVYRRVAAPYEDDKIKTNGDVYTCRD